MMFEKSTMIAHLILTQQKHDHHCQLTLTFYKSTNSNDFELGTNDVCEVLYKNLQGKKTWLPWKFFWFWMAEKSSLKLQTPMICNMLQMMYLRSTITFLVFEELIFLIFYSEHISTNVCNLVPKMIVSSSTGDS